MIDEYLEGKQEKPQPQKSRPRKGTAEKAAAKAAKRAVAEAEAEAAEVTAEEETLRQRARRSKRRATTQKKCRAPKKTISDTIRQEQASEPPSFSDECGSEHSEEEYSEDGFIIIYRRENTHHRGHRERHDEDPWPQRYNRRTAGALRGGRKRATFIRRSSAD